MTQQHVTWFLSSEGHLTEMFDIQGHLCIYSEISSKTMSQELYEKFKRGEENALAMLRMK